jgi:hypothetical protein
VKKKTRRSEIEEQARICRFVSPHKSKCVFFLFLGLHAEHRFLQNMDYKTEFRLESQNKTKGEENFLRKTLKYIKKKETSYKFRLASEQKNHVERT